MEWHEFPRAPGPGRRVCARADMPGRGTFSADLDGFPILLVETGRGVLGYVNACPHQYLPLDHRNARILSADGNMLRCSNHAATFDAGTGQGTGGFGLGCALIPVPLHEEGAAIVIG